MLETTSLELTDGGLSAIAAVLARDEDALDITHVAFGDGFGSFTKGQEILKSQKGIAPISSAEYVEGGAVIKIRAVLKPDHPVWLREVGLMSGDTLIAYKSTAEAGDLMAYIGAGHEFIFTHEIRLSSLSSSQINIIVDPNANALESLIRLHEQSSNPHGITEALAVMLAAQCFTNQLLLINHYLDE